MLLESLSFTYTANGKRQDRKWADKNMDKKWRETTNLRLEIMKSKRQVKGKLGQVLQHRVCRLT